MRSKAARSTNPRGDGSKLREQILVAGAGLLDDAGSDEVLTLRAVAREVGVAATSVYLHFSDRDALLAGVMEHAAASMRAEVDAAENSVTDPVERLQRRMLALSTWATEHFGLFKVLHESTLHLRRKLGFGRLTGEAIQAAVQRCIDAGAAPKADAATVTLDLRAAVQGMISMRINQPHLDWPPVREQIDRFLVKLVGVKPRRAK